MKRNSAVTSFILYKDKILLVKRSNKVGSYRRHWSGVSGYLESKDPLKQAKTEIKEETNLNPKTLTLLRKGKPLSVDDYKNNSFWRVHPFLFEIKKEPKIKLDWENTDYRFVAPWNLSKLKTTPNLNNSLSSVIPLKQIQPKSKLQDSALSILNDRSHGADFLSIKLIEDAYLSLKNGEYKNLLDWKKNVKVFFDYVIKERSNMAPIINRANKFEKFVASKMKTSKEDFLKKLSNFITQEEFNSTKI